MNVENMEVLRFFVILPVFITRVENLKNFKYGLEHSGIFINISSSANEEKEELECDFNDEENGVIWEVHQTNGKLASTPICLNDQNKYILKKCINGILEDQNEKCKKIQEPIKLCPDDMHPLDDYCMIVLPPKPYYESKCPYAYTLALQLNFDFPFWLGMIRDVQYGIGEFVEDGLTSIVYETGWVYDNRSIKESNCLVYYNESYIEAVDCNASHARVCLYERLHKRSFRFCSFLPYPCANPSYDHRLKKCVCVVDLENQNYEYAELVEPYQSTLDLQINAQLGLEFNGSLKWVKSGEEVSYTYWSPLGLTDFTENTKIVLTRNGWSIYNGVKVKLVEMNYTYGIQNIHISLEGPFMVVTVNDPKGFVSNMYSEYIICFTDSYPDHLFIEFHRLLVGETTSRIQADTSGTYWCKGESLDTQEIIMSNKLFITRNNIYMIEFRISYEQDEDPTYYMTAFYKYILGLNNAFSLEKKGDLLFKWMKTLAVNEEEHWVEYLLHIITDISKDHLQEYFRLRNIFRLMKWPNWVLGKSDLYNSKFCAEETTISGSAFVKWPLTVANETVRSLDICVDEDGRHIYRKCGFDFIDGVRWEKVADCYFRTMNTSDITEKLVNILEGNSTGNSSIKDLKTLTSDPNQLKPVDVFLIASILKKIERENLDLENLVRVISNVLNVSPNTLNKSQNESRATDKILQNVDLIIQNNKNRYIDKLLESKNVVVFTFCAKTTVYSGLGLINFAGNLNVIQFTRNVSFAKISTWPDLDLAAILPNSLLDHIAILNDSVITISIFLKDSLFNGGYVKEKNYAKNIAILLPGIKKFAFQIPIIFKPNGFLKRRVRNCGFWKFGANSSSWFLENAPDQSYPGLQVCYFSHTTHFGLLISNKIWKYSQILDYITIVGCTFSLIGFIGIFITACLFSQWRNRDGNKVILNYSAISVVQIILFYISYQSQENYEKTSCVVVGVLMHYAVLTQFVWMLIIAYFMYRRYVVVLHYPQQFVYNKSCVIAYTLPSITIAPLLFFNCNYVERKMGFCYPTGEVLRYTIMLPVGLIVLINIFIFLVIIVELFCKQKTVIKTASFILRLKLVVLVFFITGMSWIFGLLSQFLDSISLQFIFCTTTSLQGMILFLFFIVMNEETRKNYRNLWNRYKHGHIK